MQIKCLFLVVFIFTVFTTVQAACKFGEEFYCGSTVCEKSCATYNDTTACKAPCTDGCYCAPNYIRTAYGVCLPKFVCKYIGEVQAK